METLHQHPPPRPMQDRLPTAYNKCEAIALFQSIVDTDENAQK